MPIPTSSRFRGYAVAILAWTLAAAVDASLRLNFERAPIVHVRWASSVDDSTRARLQMRFGLADGQYDSGTTWVYVLMSPTPANIQALVETPVVEDTHHIDRVKFVVSAAAPRPGPYLTNGPRWVPGALQGLVAFFALVGVVGLVAANASAIRRAWPALRGTLIRTWPVWLFAGALTVVWVFYLARLREGAEELAPYRVGDWLVSYETGFVRRGLLGSPILAITATLGVAAERVVLWIQTALYTLFFLLLVVSVRRKQLNIWFCAFLFSPAALLFPLYDPGVAGRKDVLFFTVLALYAVWMPPPERRWPAAAAFALGAATTLVHELFFFFVPYVFVMRLLHETRPLAVRRFTPELSLFAGALIALLFASTAGADLNGEAQCADLIRRGVDERLCDSILRYPATTIRESMLEVATSVRGDRYLVSYMTAIVLAALPLVPLFAGTRGNRTRALVVASLAAFGFTVPMFAIALDWGRLLDINAIALGITIGTFFLNDRQDAPRVRNARPWWVWGVILVGVCLYLTTWSVRHCCRDPLRAGIFAED